MVVICNTLDPPDPKKPLNGAQVDSLNPEFEWIKPKVKSGDKPIMGYTIQICEDSYFSSNIIEKTVPDETYTLEDHDLEPNTLYYWRVRTENACGHGSWSIVRFFRSACPIPPGLPRLRSPGDQQTGVELKPEFIWEPVDGAMKYTIEISTDEKFEYLVKKTTVDTLYYVLLQDLLPGTKYHWHVRAENECGASKEWSATWSFTTTPKGILSAPELLYPENGILINELNPEFYWKPVPGAANYRIQISKSPDFGKYEEHVTEKNYWKCTEEKKAEGECAPLDPDTRYFWRVRAEDEDGTILGEWSSGHFNTCPALSPPSFGSPPDETDVKPNPTLSWEPVDGAMRYTVQVSRDKYFLSIDITRISNINELPLTDLEKNKTHYWRVRAERGTCIGEWSETWSFRIVDEVGGSEGVSTTPAYSDSKTESTEPPSQDEIPVFQILGFIADILIIGFLLMILVKILKK